MYEATAPSSDVQGERMLDAKAMEINEFIVFFLQMHSS
jgi:hypothetical protein